MSKDIVEMGGSDLPAIMDDQLVQIAEAAEKRIEAVKKIKQIALKVTNEHDWTDQGGKPYLQVSGSEKVGRLFGISWRLEEPVKEVHENGHFSYTYKGEFSFHGASIEAIGTRSSKDDFFSTRYQYEDGERKKINLPPSEVDSNDVKKSAFTNCLGNGITRILGIRNLTWDDLKSVGLDSSKIGRIDYKKGKDKPASKQDENGSTVDGPTQGQISLMFAKSRNVNLVSESGDRSEVEKVLQSRYKKKDFKDLTKKETKDFIEYLKTLEAMKGNPEQEQTELGV